MNLILETDSYKLSHWKQYPANVGMIHSYFESRGGRWPGEQVFFGLRPILERLSYGFVYSDIVEAEAFCSEHFRDPAIFNSDGWKRLYNKHGGALPIQIFALREGSVRPSHTPLFVVENTDPEFPWLVSFLETMLVRVWYPCTVATQSRLMRKQCEEYLRRTGGGSADYMLHDFGYRGVSSEETAAIGAMAHLTSFNGTDSIAGIRAAQNWYGAGMVGNSIPASEHSTMTIWGKADEFGAVANMLDKFQDSPVAIVMDSYNIWEAIKMIGSDPLATIIRGRKFPLVVRPDSGELPDTPVRVLNMLGEYFPPTLNTAGYKVLPDYIRIIQGDGIDYSTMSMILESAANEGWAASNFTFGSGGGLLQKLNRDTLKYAYKTSYAELGDRCVGVYKDPITDPGKKSKTGMQWTTDMELVFRNGVSTCLDAWDSIIRRVRT